LDLGLRLELDQGVRFGVWVKVGGWWLQLGFWVAVGVGFWNGVGVRITGWD